MPDERGKQYSNVGTTKDDCKLFQNCPGDKMNAISREVGRTKIYYLKYWKCTGLLYFKTPVVKKYRIAKRKPLAPVECVHWEHLRLSISWVAIGCQCVQV